MLAGSPQYYKTLIPEDALPRGIGLGLLRGPCLVQLPARHVRSERAATDWCRNNLQTSIPTAASSIRGHGKELRSDTNRLPVLIHAICAKEFELFWRGTVTFRAHEDDVIPLVLLGILEATEGHKGIQKDE